MFLISICNLLNSGFGTDLWPATNCDVRSFSKTTFEAESKSSGIIIIKLELFDNRFLNEELAELNEASLQIGPGGTDWDAKSNKILNVSTPTLTADAATKNYVDQKVEQIAAGASTPPSKWQFTGTAGANTTYTVTDADVLGDSAYDVSVNGLVKEPTVDYTVDPDTDTLTIIPSLAGGEDIVIIQRGLGIPLTQGTIGTAQINDGAVTNAKLATPYSHPNHTGDVTSTGDGATVISTDAVTTTKILEN